MALEEHMNHVPGENRGDVLLYALSTCGWCRKTRDLLDNLGVEYRYVYVDLLDGEAKSEAIKEIAVWNPSCSFPTMVINGDRCIVGYQADKIREALGNREDVEV
jgi:glutaredoxin-like protein NrdH